MLIFIIFSRNPETHIGFPEDEASIRNSPSFPLLCPYTVTQLKHKRVRSAEEWPDGRTLWNQRMVLKGGTACVPYCVPLDRAEAHAPGPGKCFQEQLLENFSESPACLHCITSCRMSGDYCPDSSPCSKSHLAFCTVLTNVHHVYRVLTSPLTLGYFLRNLRLDAMDCSVKNIPKAVFRYGKLVQQSQVSSASSGA